MAGLMMLCPASVLAESDRVDALREAIEGNASARQILRLINGTERRDEDGEFEPVSDEDRLQMAAILGEVYLNNPDALKRINFENICKLDAFQAIWGSEQNFSQRLLNQWVRSSRKARRLSISEQAWLVGHLERSGDEDALDEVRGRLMLQLAEIDPAQEEAGVFKDAVVAAAPGMDRAACRALLEKLSVSFFDPSAMPDEMSLRDPAYMSHLRAWQVICEALRTEESCEALYMRALMPMLRNFREYDLYWRYEYEDYVAIASPLEAQAAIDVLRAELSQASAGSEFPVAEVNTLSCIYRLRG
ncbi:MAG: hypothetical protein AAF709_14475, partial [Pseudomonadota bacterium]